MNYIKQNHLAILALLGIIAILVFGNVGIPKFGALDRTTVGNPWTFSGAVTHSSTLTQTGVATFAVSPVFTSGITTLVSGTFTQGGGIRSISTTTSGVLSATDFDVEDMIEITPGATGLTQTLPATSTLSSFIATAGQHRSLMICNASTTALGSFTLAEGTGMNLHQATSTLVLRPTDCAVLEFYRATDTDIELYYDLGF